MKILFTILLIKPNEFVELVALIIEMDKCYRHIIDYGKTQQYLKDKHQSLNFMCIKKTYTNK